MDTWQCRTLGSALDAVAAATDGDVIQLVWPSANQFSKASVESRAIGLGVDVIVEIAPQKGPDNA